MTTATLRNPDDASGRLFATRLFATTLIACAVLFTALRWARPYSGPLFADTKNTVEKAAAENAAGRWANSGLVGTRGFAYGSLGVNVYQVWLRLTADVRTMHLLQTTLVTLLAVAGVLLLGLAWRGFLPWYEALPFLLVPSFWHHSRTLWDINLMIPLPSLALAFYLFFVRGGRAPWLVGAGFTLGVMLDIHPMAIPFGAALAAHALWFRRAELRAAPLVVAGAVLATLVPIAPYLVYLATEARSQGEPYHFPWFAHTADFAIGGFKTLSVLAMRRLAGGDWGQAYGVAPALAAATTAAGSVVLVHAALGLHRALRLTRDPSAPPFLRDVARVSLLVIAFAVLVQFLTRTPMHLHYYYAAWPAYACILMLAWERFRASRLMALSKVLYVLSLAVALKALFGPW